MIIKLKCPCGGEIELQDSLNTQIELMAKEWLSLHRPCLTARVSPIPTGITMDPDIHWIPKEKP